MKTLIPAVALSLAAPAFAQHTGHSAPTTTPSAPIATATDPDCPPEHAKMGHCVPKAAPAVLPPKPSPPPPPPPAATTDPDCPPEHAELGHCTPKTGGTAAPTPGSVPASASPGAPSVAPPPPGAFSGPEHAADTVFNPALMADKRATALIAEHGGYTGYMVLLDRTEFRAVRGRNGYAWDWEGWYGGDYDRLWIKTEGGGDFGGTVESAEVQALFTRAIDPWFNLQTGIRYDLRPRPDRAHLAVGILGLAPYWFEVDAAVFLSTKGDLSARVEVEYDQRLTNRLVLQPRVEFDLAAQDVPEYEIGAGLSKIEAGLRLRYEIKREFAPYVGVEYERSIGKSARFARAAGERVGGWAFLAGIRSWF